MIYPRFPGMWVFTETKNAVLPTALAIYWDNVFGISCSLGQLFAAGAPSLTHCWLCGSVAQGQTQTSGPMTITETWSNGSPL